MDNKRLTLNEMADELRISPKTFRRYLTKYKIPHSKIGRTRLFLPSEVHACIRTVETELTANVSPVAARKHRPARNRFAESLGLV